MTNCVNFVIHINIYENYFKYETRERERVKSKLGFTLIELLIVIAIIGLLSSVVLASLNSARKKARDARRISDVRQISIAIQMYYDRKNSMPINRTPGVTYNDAQPNFLQELVDEGLLSNNPKDVQSPMRRYYYYDYGPGNFQGAMVTVEIETIKNHPNSCMALDYQYVVCNPY